MRLIFSFLVTISYAIAANAGYSTGTWAIELSAPDGQTYRPEATITKTEDKLEGSYYSPRTDQTFDLRDVKLDAENTVHFTLDTQGLKVAYRGKIKGNKMSGSARIDYQGQQYDAGFSATRKAKTDSVSGTWDMETVMQRNKSQSTLLLAVANDGEISATRKLKNRTVEIEDAKLLDGVLTFSTKGKYQGYDYVAYYKGQVEGDTIEGELVISAAAAGATREFAWTANRVD
ncbi:MAG: hypothetical protein P8L49_11910 [Opitutaceae bacterium]|nr:hypothetical protein [Opitutaceae bacterium]